MTTIDARLPAIIAALQKRGDAYAPLVKALRNYSPYTGGVLYRYDALPDGALVGPVWKALRQIERSIGYDARNSKARKDAGYCRAASVWALWDDDANAAVCDALETWLGLKTEARDAKV